MEKKEQNLDDLWYTHFQRACMEFALKVISLSRFAFVTFNVMAICLVSILILLGVICIVYSFYCRSRIRSQGFVHLNYFNGPWIIRIGFILFVIWWSLGEIIRLTLLKHTLHLKWKETICKCYIVSNLGFAEPCLILTLVFLLRAPLQRLETRVMSKKWNVRAFCYIILYCLPMFLLQVFVILVESHLDNNKGFRKKITHYITSTSNFSYMAVKNDDIAICTYPLHSIVLLGLFAIISTSYLLWLGIQISKLVINKGLQKRVYTLLIAILCFLPLRVLFLGLSVLSRPGHFMFEAFVFLSFVAHVCCYGVCMCTLVYRPIADCLATRNLQDLEARPRRFNDDDMDTVTLIANQSLMEDTIDENARPNPHRYYDSSAKCG